MRKLTLIEWATGDFEVPRNKWSGNSRDRRKKYRKMMRFKANQQKIKENINKIAEILMKENEILKDLKWTTTENK